jgi:hypothetical protein
MIVTFSCSANTVTRTMSALRLGVSSGCHWQCQTESRCQCDDNSRGEPRPAGPSQSLSVPPAVRCHWHSGTAVQWCLFPGSVSCLGESKAVSELRLSRLLSPSLRL